MTSGRKSPSWWRLWSVQGSFAPDARQWLGWIVALDGTRSDDDRSWVDAEPRALNTNPHLFGVLVGARLGIEESGHADAPELARTITEVLPSTLGAIGDRLIWTGVRPAAVAVAAALAPWSGPAAAVGAWVVFAVAQGWFRDWTFTWARRHGAAVAGEINRLPLHAIADRARGIGAFAVGFATIATVLEWPSTESLMAAGPAAVGALVAGSVLVWRRADPFWSVLAALVVASVAVGTVG
mgnify:CR=1 FL=1